MSETKVPEGISEIAHLDTNNPVPGIETSMGEEDTLENPYDVGYEGDGKTLKPGASFYNGIFEDSLEDKAEEAGILTDGVSPDPQAIEVSPAQRAARRMEKLIHDQIEESNGTTELRNALFEAVLLGTGIVKGPFNYNKTLHSWETKEDGTRAYRPEGVRVPRLEFVSAWEGVCDVPDAADSEEEFEEETFWASVGVRIIKDERKGTEDPVFGTGSSTKSSSSWQLEAPYIAPAPPSLPNPCRSPAPMNVFLCP